MGEDSNNLTGFFSKDKNDDLNKIINALRWNKNAKVLRDYVIGVKKGTKINDFFEDDFLARVIIKLVDTPDIDINVEWEKLLNTMKLVFPFGKETDDYKLLKEMMITNLANHTKLFNDRLFAIFTDKQYYLYIMNIILSNPKITERSSYIFEYAQAVAPYCQNESILSKDIINFIRLLEVCDDIKQLIQDTLYEAKKRVGVYPIDEKTLVLIADEARKAQMLIVKIENMQTNINSYVDKINVLMDKRKTELDDEVGDAIKKINSFIEELKESLFAQLNEYLNEIEENLKKNSDEVFKQILSDAAKKINDVKFTLQRLSSATSSELLRIQTATEESVTKLKEYVENDKDLQSLLKDANNENVVREILTNVRLTGSPIITTSSSNPETVPANNVETNNVSAGIYIPGNDRLIVPRNSEVILPDDIDTNILPAFDESIPFDERLKNVLARKKAREERGEIFHHMTDEVISCIMEGDWVYLWGPSGCGKSYVIKQVASLLGINLVENGKITDKYSVMAYNDPHGRFRATQAFVALLYGNLLSLDEFDNGNPDTQVVLNELYSGLLDVIENPRKKRFVTFAEDMTVPINPNFRMVSLGNTSGNGEDEHYSSRGKIDESVQERMTPKKFDYDNRVEERIFGDYKAWYELFVEFRDICSNYAKKTGSPSVQGMVTTRDAAAIVKYIKHNSKTPDQIFREKFIQVKKDDYLYYIRDELKKFYGISEGDYCQKEDVSLDDKYYTPERLAKQLIYSSNEAITSGKR